MCDSDWSSDVCSSDLDGSYQFGGQLGGRATKNGTAGGGDRIGHGDRKSVV